ncbi:hypothetical protein [Sediminitomix flava]|uniref:Uncharacterized protein n=1 Tax=Sediminitomix flava TaxID=379075 RepID=A0A315Z9Q5_SEDFL|nr:hypothetical protein [Sediminitomix flava]PWJ41919.1 hypothetical protein BC781_103169 [Sediminitomix flava]
MKKLIFTFATTIALSANAFASNDLFDLDANKYDRLRKKVALSTAMDWETPLAAAKVCVKDKQNMSEAYTWIEHSIAIKETASNLELKGDYLALHCLDQMAFEYYQKALVQKIEKGETNFSSIQKKILALKK